MQSVPKKIFQILDGTPAVYGQRSRGQSLVELALITPLLIVLLMGLAEIGWFANNYLILLETTRVGARYGAVQTDTKAPSAWPLAASLIPALQDQTKPLDIAYAQNFRKCPFPGTDYQRFFNTIVCPMIQSAMTPLPFRSDFTGDLATALTPSGSNGVDDIVVSTFALKSLNPLDPDIPVAMRSTLQLVQGRDATQQQVVVVGRYPENANECTFDTAADKDTRDPFDYINYTNPANTDLPTRNFIYPSTLPAVPDNKLYYELPGYDVNSAAAPERQRGFDFTGQHVITSTRGLPANQRCYGSEWTIDRVQQLMNVTNFSLVNQSQRSTIPSQGLILVEMFWQHTLLLRNPVFNPVFNILNDPTNPNGGGTVISVWAAFPLPSIEPRIKYALGS